MSLVWDENFGSCILIDKTAVKPSFISSPDKVSLFLLLFLSFEYLFITLVKALLNPSRCVPPSFWGMLLVKGRTSSEYPAFHSNEHSTITLFSVAVTKTGFLNISFSFLFTKIGFFLLICFTNSIIPPSYLCWNSSSFFENLSKRVMLTPLFRKANSLILFSIIVELNLIDEKTSLEGKKFIFVPFFFVLPICFNECKVFPF